MWHHRSPTQTPGSTQHLHCSQGSVLLLTVPVFQWVALQIVLPSALHPFLFYASSEERVPFYCLHNSVNMGLLVTVSQAFLKSLSRSTYIPPSCVKGILMQNLDWQLLSQDSFLISIYSIFIIVPVKPMCLPVFWLVKTGLPRLI